jgi:UDP-N-acetylmuramate--alanine ligase
LEGRTTRRFDTDKSKGESITNADLESVKGDYHFIGIGGIGMSALARLLLAEGRTVSGSDKEESAITDQLKSLGARIFIGHKLENVKDAGIVVVSTAIVGNNPELIAAKMKEIKVAHRSDVLAWLSYNRKLVAVSGTHGKTTTTGMLAQIFLDCKLDPSIVVGGIFSRLGANSVAGKGEYFIAEADESDKSHARLKSTVAIITNVEADHLENYPGGMEEILETMASFANRSKLVILCADDDGCRKLIERLRRPWKSYGNLTTSPDAEYCYEPTEQGFNFYKAGQKLGEVSLSVPGRHNKENAAAAVAAALECGITFEQASAALGKFTGIARRFQIIGSKSAITVVDDYGHHPTEVKATLEAARQWQAKQGTPGRIVAVFQPHQPGRLRDLWGEFRESFKDADLLLLTDIYVARGSDIPGVTSERFAQSVVHTNVHYLSGPTAELPAKIAPHLRAGDLVLTIGAGDITRIGPALLKQL